MSKSKTPFEVPANITAMIEQNLEQTRGAVNSYLQFIQQGISASPWGGTELNNKVRTYAERNVANAFAFAEKMIHAKDLPDLVRIQAEFVQTQLQALTEQARDVGETVTKSAMDAAKGQK